jgi:HEAT repeat protein
VELLGPLVLETQPTVTLPPREGLLAAWCVAAEASGTPRTPLLAEVATDLYQLDEVRARAVEELGHESDPAAGHALHTVLIESTGNAYLRRKAAQSIARVLPREEACAVLEQVFTHEADLNFQRFLAAQIEELCR